MFDDMNTALLWVYAEESEFGVFVLMRCAVCRTNPHWRESRDHDWADFFDLEALRKAVPNVIELNEFIATHGTGTSSLARGREVQ